MVTGSTPILASSDILRTIKFYKEVLGFPESWTYGDPPGFGCASWGSARIFFSHQPDLAARVEGHTLWLDVDGIDDLYSKHLERGVEIVTAIDNMPWGFREYVVRDLDGYHLRFAGQPGHVSKGSGEFPSGVQIVTRLATPEEFEAVTAAGFGQAPKPSDSLERSWGGVVALSPEGEAIGVVRIMFDAPGWYSVWDVAVVPEWQGNRIGSKMMEAATKLVTEAEPGSFLYLFTYKGPFYERLGFKKESLHMRRV